MTQQKHALALLLAVALIIVLLSSSALIVIHADHDCVGESCEICEMLCVCAERLQQLAVAVVLIVLAVAATALFRDRAADAAFSHTAHTLVALKVKLSS